MEGEGVFVEGAGTDLEVGHGDLVHHLVLALIHALEEVVERARHDARVVICAQHRVRLPST